MKKNAATATGPKPKKLTRKQLHDAALNRILGEESGRGWKVLDEPITTKKGWAAHYMREAPRSIDELAMLVKVSKTAAQSLIGDLRQAATTVTRNALGRYEVKG